MRYLAVNLHKHEKSSSQINICFGGVGYDKAWHDTFHHPQQKRMTPQRPPDDATKKCSSIDFTLRTALELSGNFERGKCHLR